MTAKDVIQIVPTLLSLFGKVLKPLFVNDDFEQFFYTMPEAAIIATDEGVMAHVNDEFAAAIGYKASELKGKKFMGFVHGDDHNATVNEMSSLKMGGVTIGFKNRYKHSKGHYVTLEWRAKRNGKIYATARIVET